MKHFLTTALCVLLVVGAAAQTKKQKKATELKSKPFPQEIIQIMDSLDFAFEIENYEGSPSSGGAIGISYVLLDGRFASVSLPFHSRSAALKNATIRRQSVSNFFETTQIKIGESYLTPNGKTFFKKLSVRASKTAEWYDMIFQIEKGGTGILSVTVNGETTRMAGRVMPREEYSDKW